VEFDQQIQFGIGRWFVFAAAFFLGLYPWRSQPARTARFVFGLWSLALRLKGMRTECADLFLDSTVST
jgi:hypothetical protein